MSVCTVGFGLVHLHVILVKFLGLDHFVVPLWLVPSSFFESVLGFLEFYVGKCSLFQVVERLTKFLGPWCRCCDARQWANPPVLIEDRGRQVIAAPS